MPSGGSRGWNVDDVAELRETIEAECVDVSVGGDDEGMIGGETDVRDRVGEGREWSKGELGLR